MTSGSLHWGIIGCGDVVMKKSGPSILQAGGSRIVAVMRREAAKACPFAEAHGIALCTDDAAAVLNHPEVDIVYVATPPSSHRQYVVAAAEAGKHVLVEKPMGLSATEDREMIAVCEAAGVELFVAYYRRFHPHVLKMKELIDSGRIGRPVSAAIEYAQPPAPGTSWGGGWRVQPDVSGGGLFVDVVSHRIDLMVYLLGEPAEVCGLTAKVNPESRVEQTVSLAVRFAGDTLCSVSGSFASLRWADRFVIAGTEGAIEAASLDSHAFTLRAGKVEQEYRFDRDRAPHLGLVRHIERVLDGQEGNASCGRQGMLADRVLDEGLRRGQ
ncbi:MAG TPA: Gfo/Idh/MocA family oxidoreductase [Phycisphaerae bacterium]|nr:Gfo/Idh/MocA family oxidoreductase [Phycisphaerae bacterium]HOI53818.1 Gfo/Idh/MocA family oxidoreductase [Phycisphaerae bacterium]